MWDTYATVLRHKIWFDLWGARQRTLQAILTIAIGAFAVGAIFGGWEGILADIGRGWSASSPATINLRVSPAASDDLLDTIGRTPGVAAVEGQMEAPVRWRPGPGAAWMPATLVARDDYRDMRLNAMRLDAGAWPDGRIVGVERGYGLAPGDTIELRVDTPGQSYDERLPVGGVVTNYAIASAYLGGDLLIYTTRERFAAMVGVDAFQKVTVAVADYTPARAAAVAEAIERDLQDQGATVQPAGFRGRDKVSDPGKSPMADNVAGIGLILQSIGVISVVLGLLLIYNTITAIIAQQTAQIGELKAVGASAGQILVVYVTVVFAYGLGALLIAVPLGIVAANGLRLRLVTMLGADPGPLTVAGGPVLIQVALCLLAPLAIAALPILQGARITVREAMSSYGLSSAGSRLDEALARATWLSRAMSLAVSNAFRNRQRVLLTQLALAGAGLTFMAVLSARTSLVYSMNDLYFDLYRFPIQLTLLGDASDRELAGAEDVARVAGTEVWRQLNVFVRPSGAPPAVTDRHPQLLALPLPSRSYTPLVLEGRWLEPDDQYAVVLHQQLARDVGVAVGDWVTISVPDLTSADRWRSQRDWQVVGLLMDPTSTAMLIAPRDAVAAEVGGASVGNRVQVDATPGLTDGGAALARELRAYYEARGIDVAASDTDTLAQRSAEFTRNVTTITSLLILMALIVAAVGGIALSGVLSIGVLERRREIGVLRAIGATPRTVLTQFIAEGLMMGWLSWLIALALSYPAGAGLVSVLSRALQLSFVYQYSLQGVTLWLALATLIGIFASWSPAQGAIRASVQESLAYE